MAGYTNNQYGVPTILSTTNPTTFTAGAPGGSGKANDTILTGIKIAKNAGPATVTLSSGFRSDVSSNDTTHYVFTGSTSQDTWLPLNWLNTGGPLTVTASVAYTVTVETIAAALSPT